MFCFVVNFWNVRHHTGKDKTSNIFFINPGKSLFMPIFIVNSQVENLNTLMSDIMNSNLNAMFF